MVTSWSLAPKFSCSLINTDTLLPNRSLCNDHYPIAHSPDRLLPPIARSLIACLLPPSRSLVFCCPTCSLIAPSLTSTLFCLNFLPYRSLYSTHPVPSLLNLPYKSSPQPFSSYFLSRNIWDGYYVEHTSKFATNYCWEDQISRADSAGCLRCRLVRGFQIWEESYLRPMCRLLGEFNIVLDPWISLLSKDATDRDFNGAEEEWKYASCTPDAQQGGISGFQMIGRQIGPTIPWTCSCNCLTGGYLAPLPEDN